MKKKRLHITVVSLLIMLLLTGCWNNRPLKDLGICTAIGIDKPEYYPIEVSAQIAKTSALGTQAEGGGTSGEKAFFYASLKAFTFHGCARNIFTTHLDRDLYVNHVQLIVIGEEYAKLGIADGVEFWERDHECSIDTLVIIAKELQATKVLQAESEYQKVPAVHIVKSIRNTEATSEAYEITLFDALQKMNTEGVEMTLGSFRFEPGSDGTSLDEMDVRGAAAFKGDKLVGWLNKDETKALRITENELTGGVFEVPNPFQEGKYINYELFNASTKYEVSIQNNKPSINIKVEAKGGISEIQGDDTVVNESNIEVMESAAGKYIKQQIEKTVSRAQHELNSDIFGIGLQICKSDPQYWETIRENWYDIYQSVPVNVEVNVSTFEFQAGRIFGRSKAQ